MVLAACGGVLGVALAADVISINEGYDLHETARLLALVNMSMADGFISGWYWKRIHAFWRPVTAIREADTDGNPDTTQDASWSPLRPTPRFRTTRRPTASSAVPPPK